MGQREVDIKRGGKKQKTREKEKKVHEDPERSKKNNKKREA